MMLQALEDSSKNQRQQTQNEWKSVSFLSCGGFPLVEEFIFPPADDTGMNRNESVPGLPPILAFFASLWSVL